MPNAEERSFAEPRLAHLLGLEEGGSWGKEELFGAWRLLFERLSEQFPVVLLFEDLQWADASLVEFVSYLLEWSRSYPIFVLCLARPELQATPPRVRSGLAQPDDALPRAALRAGDGRSPRRIRARASGRRFGADPRAGGGRTAVRSRDGADAARPRLARRGRRRLRADRADRGARSPGDPAGPDRRSPGRPRAGRATRAPGRLRARKDVLEGSSRVALRACPGASSSRCSRRWFARRSWESRQIRAHPSAGSTDSSRTSSAAWRTTRSRGRSGRRGISRLRHSSRRASARPSRRSSRCVAAHYVAAYEAQPDADDADAIRQSARELLCTRRRASRLARRAR